MIVAEVLRQSVCRALVRERGDAAKDERLRELVQDVRDAIRSRFEFIKAGELDYHRSGWPSCGGSSLARNRPGEFPRGAGSQGSGTNSELLVCFGHLWTVRP